MKSFSKRSLNWRKTSELSSIRQINKPKQLEESKKKVLEPIRQTEQPRERQDLLSSDTAQDKKDTKKKKNKQEKKIKMDTSVLNEAENIANSLNNVQKKVKVLKKDKGLIERTESSKIVLTEDNRQVLND